jgi:TPR repeat protein
VPRDAAAAAAWYRRAAEQGNAEAQLAIAGLYYQGEGVPRNYATALEWFRAAASQGSATAQASIAVMYERGLGVRRDPVVAHAWLSVAADSGDDAARRRLQGFDSALSSAQRVEAEQLKLRLVAALRSGQ